jgi:methionyl-tRNA formyltransferase
MNIFYIGSSGALSLEPFKRLLSSEHSVAAVGVFNPIVLNDKIIALENSSLSLLAAQQNISIIDLSQTVGLIVEQIKQLSIDVILMSCYGKHLPDEVATLAKSCCLNMHPSLLPKYRGPEPIFWQMKYGDKAGVSWHHVTKEFDAGAVVKQQVVFLEDGLSYQEVNSALAVAGANLMMDILAELSTTTLSGSQQDDELSSYYRYPVKEDFVVDIMRSAQDVFNFMKATEAFASPYFCQIGGHRYMLDKALDFDNNEHLQVAEVSGNTLNIPCKEGVLSVTYTGKL